MGLFSRLFGASDSSTITDEQFIHRARRGLPLDIDALRSQRQADLEGYRDLMWGLVTDEQIDDPSKFIEALCAEDLQEDDQQDLLSAATAHPGRLPWLALDALRASAPTGWLRNRPDSRDDVATALGCLAESAINGGPAGDLFDLEELPALVGLMCELIEDNGASTHELAALPWLLKANQDIEPEEPEDQELIDTLQSTLTSAMKRKPRDHESPWQSLLPEQISQGDADDALAALTAARACDIEVKESLRARIADKGDPTAWSLGAMCLDWPEIVAAMSTAGVAALQSRRMREGELCSLSSQAGCQSCGSGPGAADDELMVPQALEEMLTPVLQVTLEAPIDHEDLLVECIAAPSITLRFYGLSALSRAEPESLQAQTWEIIEALKGDSHPQVQQLVLLLLEGRPS